MSFVIPGSEAPAFETTTLDGTSVALPSGGWTLLSFLRYASCPMCNLRVRELRLRDAELRSAGIKWVAVFHSPPHRLLRHFPAEIRSHIVADPGRVLYGQFGVGQSWWGAVVSVVVPSFYWRFLKATALGFWGGAVDQSIHSMPADFLVSPDGMVQRVHYGKHIGDHMEVSAALAALRERDAPTGSRSHRT